MRYILKRRDYQLIMAKPRGGDRHSGKIEAHGGFIRELIAAQGDMTLVEVQERLIERGALVGIGTVHRFFVPHGMTRKKTYGPPRPQGVLFRWQTDRSASTYTA